MAKKKAAAKKPTVEATPEEAVHPSADLSHIVEGLRPLAEPIDNVKPHPKNVRKHADRDQQALRASLKDFGQRTPIVANRKTGHVLKGNGTLAAAKKLQWAHVAVVWVEEDPKHEGRYMVADNRAAELSDWDEENLAAVLDELKAAEQVYFAGFQEVFDLESLFGGDEEDPDHYIHPADKPLEETPAPDEVQGMPLPELLRSMRRRVVMFSAFAGLTQPRQVPSIAVRPVAAVGRSETTLR